MKRRHTEQSPLRSLLAGGLMFALVGLLMDVRGVGRVASRSPRQVCQGETQSEVVVSREQLAHLLLVPERDSKAKVEQILNQPYCQLPGLEVRAGVVSERVAYPLAFDPQTWLVILYEGDEYAGYEFRVQ
jgi:hypothetical protein